VGITRFNGQDWEAVGGATGAFSPASIRDMCVYDDGTGPGLYVACVFTPQATVFSECIVRWNGTQWSSVGGGVWSPESSSRQVDKLAVFDDGSGSGQELYVMGQFILAGGAGGLPVRGITKWNGHRWAAVGQGLGQYIGSAAVAPDPRGTSLFIGGTFETVGAGVSPSMAQWVGCPSCYANCDTSAAAPRLNVADFTCFLRKFAVRDPYANCNQDPVIDAADFSCYLQKFAAGCP